MAERTGIAWTDHTYNPWWGCTKVSPGCDRCYAEAFDKRVGGSHWGPHAERRRIGDATRNLPRKWNRAAEKAGVRARVFCASMADVFDNAVPTEWRDELWALIRNTPSLDWQLLTKRPQNIAKMLPADWGVGYSNVWLGTTAENQVEFDRRWPHLRALSSAVRFISYEPAIGALWLPVHDLPDWVICGGESGGRARLTPQDWALSVMEQCANAGVPFFMKQVGSRHDGWGAITGKGHDPAEWPIALRVQQFPTPESRPDAPSAARPEPSDAEWVGEPSRSLR